MTRRTERLNDQLRPKRTKRPTGTMLAIEPRWLSEALRLRFRRLFALGILGVA